MEVQDGFILGIYNYCDRWCETCPFTSRCRSFAEHARFEAKQDPSFQAITSAPPHPQDVREPPPWLADAIREMNAAVEEALKNPPTTDELNARLPPVHEEISHRAKEYAFRALEWCRDTHQNTTSDANDPLAVVIHFSTMIASKAYRAMSGLAEFDGDREFPPDHEGSAKVMLIGVERSMTAWQDLVAVGRISDTAAAPLLADLQWLRCQVDTLIPRARTFVRPAFDEPEEVRKLEVSPR